MLGVTLGYVHSYYDLKLWLKSYPKITPPSPKTKYVDVPGMDGRLDLSKALTGYMHYDRRTITMEFSILAPRERWPEIHSDIMDKLHGADIDVILDDDPDFCYTGTATVVETDPQKVTSGVTILVDVEPYKTRIEPTRKTFTVSGFKSDTIIMDSKKPVIPTITASAAMKMTYSLVIYDLEEGENFFPDVIMREGGTGFIFEGEGTVSFEYREGRF